MKKTWKRENLGVKFPSACSIEETGLDSPSFGECMSVLSSQRSRGGWSRVPALHLLTQRLAGKNESNVESLDGSDEVLPPCPDCVDELKKPVGEVVQPGNLSAEEPERHGKEKRRLRKLHRNISGHGRPLHKRGESPIREPLNTGNSTKVNNDVIDKAECSEETGSDELKYDGQPSISAQIDEEIMNFSDQNLSEMNVQSSFVPSNSGAVTCRNQSGAGDLHPFDVNKLDQEATETMPQSVDTQRLSCWTPADQESTLPLNVDALPEDIMAENSALLGSPQGAVDPVGSHVIGDQENQNQDNVSSGWGSEMPISIVDDPLLSNTEERSLRARNRWRRLKHTVSFANHLASSSRYASKFPVEGKTAEELSPQFNVKEDVGGVGAAIFEGTKTGPRLRAKGRKGMEALLVRQEKSIINFLQDFYVACLKMPIGHFLAGVFVAPVLLGLFFTPLYIFDLGGLTFEDGAIESKIVCPLISTAGKCYQYLNVFLYALSLSTTFGGSPVAAQSPYCILIANLNTLMAQFLFVFLSGAVFARMSHPSHPLRCSKKAIIRKEDFVPTVGADYKETFRVYAVRLVLTGPLPCELVDVKICLTYRIFVKLPNGSTFCATQDLELVRPEVSYLRYGLMVRHIINRKSPLFGHTMDSLVEGDASFSLTIMGVERTSMQPVFHLQDYFVCDGDVVWDGDYVDFVETNEKGQRVLNHSKIDALRPFKVTGMVVQAISRMGASAQAARQRREEIADKEDSTKND